MYNKKLSLLIKNFKDYQKKKSIVDKKKNKILIKNIKENYLNQNTKYIIIKKFERNKSKIKKQLILFASLFGKKCPQSKKGNILLEIKPNKSKISKISSKSQLKKLRYHQTNQGGSIHSDGPQLNKPPKYVFMACISNAKSGGESIINNTEKIYEHLRKYKPEYLKCLKKKFLFERRGFNYPNKNIFRKPIFEINKNKFKFRYLKEYIESAYKIKNLNMSSLQKESINYLDKCLNNKKFQKRYKLSQGDIIILNNNSLAHGRSKFSISSKSPRSFLRLWIK